MTIFYAPDITGTSHVLNPEESRHCVRVLRLRAGDAVALVDGRGGMFEARVRTADPRGCELDIERTHREWGRLPRSLTLAVAPTKNTERWEWMVEKCTEIGVGTFIPLISARSERRVLRHDRAEKIIISAMKQSLKAYKPVLEPPLDFAALVARPFAGAKLIAHCMEERHETNARQSVILSEAKDLKANRHEILRFAQDDASSRCISQKYISDCLPPSGDVLLLIGPEGDFSPEEVALALSHGFQPISLGDSRLRTETAAMAAAVEVSLAFR